MYNETVITVSCLNKGAWKMLFEEKKLFICYDVLWPVAVLPLPTRPKRNQRQGSLMHGTCSLHLLTLDQKKTLIVSIRCHKRLLYYHEWGRITEYRLDYLQAFLDRKREKKPYIRNRSVIILSFVVVECIVCSTRAVRSRNKSHVRQFLNWFQQRSIEIANLTTSVNPRWSWDG